MDISLESSDSNSNSDATHEIIKATASYSDSSSNTESTFEEEYVNAASSESESESDLYEDDPDSLDFSEIS